VSVLGSSLPRGAGDITSLETVGRSSRGKQGEIEVGQHIVPERKLVINASAGDVKTPTLTWCIATLRDTSRKLGGVSKRLPGQSLTMPMAPNHRLLHRGSWFVESP